MKNRLRLLKKEGKGNNFLETMIGADENYREKIGNALFYLPKEQVEKWISEK